MKLIDGAEALVTLGAIHLLVAGVKLYLGRGKMDIKVGANGDIALAVNAAGDIVVSFTDKEVMSDEGGQIALHPVAIGAAIVKALGGSPTVQAVVGYAIPALVALLPKQP